MVQVDGLLQPLRAQGQLGAEPQEQMVQRQPSHRLLLLKNTRQKCGVGALGHGGGAAVGLQDLDELVVQRVDLTGGAQMMPVCCKMKEVFSLFLRQIQTKIATTTQI